VDNVQLPLVLSEANWVDIGIALILVTSAIGGIRRGLVLGSLDLLGAVFAFAAAFVAYPFAAQLIVRLLPLTGFSLPEPATNVLAFIVVLLVAQLAYGIVSGWVGMVLRAVLNVVPPLAWLDRILGLAPGLVRGLAISVALLLPFALLPVLPQVSDTIARSQLGSRLVAAALSVAPDIEARLGRDLASGLPGLVLTPPSPGETERLVIGPTGALTPDQDAEMRMWQLVNQERERSGLRPLAFDEELRPVTRAHSREMFELGYFSHTSPVTGTPFDRMRAAGVRFGIAGENLAYTRTVEMAHTGLMASPGHRANILRPEFRRVGIGVMRSEFQGSMFTQNFRD
jgi:uncharacterized protein YkwD